MAYTNGQMVVPEKDDRGCYFGLFWGHHRKEKYEITAGHASHWPISIAYHGSEGRGTKINDQDRIVVGSALPQPLVALCPHVGHRNRSSLAETRYWRDEGSCPDDTHRETWKPGILGVGRMRKCPRKDLGIPMSRKADPAMSRVSRANGKGVVSILPWSTRFTPLDVDTEPWRGVVILFIRYVCGRWYVEKEEVRYRSSCLALGMQCPGQHIPRTWVLYRGICSCEESGRGDC